MKVILSLVLFASSFCFASVEVAFIELKNYQGQVVQLEPNGQFAHIAISYQGVWLHSHPIRGVELTTEHMLQKMGTIKQVITVPNLAALDEAQVEKFIGKPYDGNYSWDDEKIYCSELIAKLLGIKPQPMKFDPSLWPASFQKMKGQLGISPDDIFKILKNRLG